jgi:hypothetical protein
MIDSMNVSATVQFVAVNDIGKMRLIAEHRSHIATPVYFRPRAPE